MYPDRTAIAVSLAVLLISSHAGAVPQHRPVAPPGADRSHAVLTLQVALDRAGHSPGEIDGVRGANTDRAVAALVKARGLQSTPSDQELLTQLGDAATSPLTTYTITAEDVAGPFVPNIPADIADQAALPALLYKNLLEALGERFHASPSLLTRLNPNTRFAAGVAIQVPRTADRSIPADASVVRVAVSKSASTLLVFAGDRIVFSAPVTSGSEHDPLPLGEWKVTAVQRDPPFHYNPELFWDAKPRDQKARIAPGPNNPVGVVWIDLSKEHYGLHGTPEPSRVGHTQSHGCVRLTNWDAATVASLVRAGTVVAFTE